MSKIWNLPKVELLPLSEVKENRDAALLYSGPAWNIIKPKLNIPVIWEAEIKGATRVEWESALKELKGEVIYAVGGGLPSDAAKFMGLKRDLPVVSVPTALSVDAFFTWASGIREGGCVHYLETKIPDSVLVDLEVIASAPRSIRAAGICDVLSIATGSWDWTYAEKRGKNSAEMRYLPWVAGMAQDILQAAIDCAKAAGMGDSTGLKTLLDCLMLEVQLCNQVGHARPEEGSEHYFAYSVENRMGPGWPHADLLGPGILLMMSLQGQEISKVKKALHETNIPLLRIPIDSIETTLLTLADYCQKQNLPFGRAHELKAGDIQEISIESLLK